MQNFDLSLFTPVKMRIVHEGLTDKGYIFTADSIFEASNSIKNTPILAHYDKRVHDARGHEMGVERDSTGRAFMKFYERPIGVIPESSEVSFEYDPTDNKTYATVTGFIWKKYANEMNSVLSRDKEKKISMEIIIDTMFSSEQGPIVTSYRYTGITILGNDIQPGISGANLKVLDEFGAEFSKEEKESTETMIINGKVVSFSADELQGSESGSLKLPESSKIGQKVESSTKVDEEKVEDNKVEDNEVEETEKNSSEDSNKDLTDEQDVSEADQILEGISKEELAKLVLERQAKEAEEKLKEQEVEPKTDESKESKTVEDIEEEIDKAEEDDRKAEIAELKAKLAEYESLIAEQEKVKKEELLKKFNDVKETKEYSELNLEELSYEDLELRLYAIRGKHASTKRSNEKSRIIPGPLSSLGKAQSQIADPEESLAKLIAQSKQNTMNNN